jgi:hypothetical protein
MLELLEHGNVYKSGGKVMGKGGEEGTPCLWFFKKRLTVQPFRVKFLLKVAG